MKKIKIAHEPVKINQFNVRFLWADIIRIIAIYLVIQVHSRYLPLNAPWYMQLFAKLDVMGVPLFVLLSGSLLLGKQEDYQTFFIKRCRKVLFPWIIWTFIYMYYFYTFHHGQITQEFFRNSSSHYSNWLHFFFRVFMSNLWFLPMIFGIYLLTPIYRIITKYASTRDIFYILIIWFIFESFLPFLFNNPLFPVWEPNVVMAPIQYSGYFFAGFLVTKSKMLKLRKIFLFLAFTLIPFYISLIPMNIKYLKNFTSEYLFPGTIFATICFFLFLFYITITYENRISNLFKKILSLISAASFGVYIIHGIILDHYRAFIVSFLHSIHADFFLTFTIFIISAGVVIIMQRIPILRNIIP